MSRKRRQTYSGCSIEPHRGELRLRFRVVLSDGTSRRVARRTGLPDTEANRSSLRSLAKLIGAAVDNGRSFDEIDAIIAAPRGRRPPEMSAPAAMETPTTGPTVREYYEAWIREQAAVVRPHQLRDYREQMRSHILEALGKIPLSELRPAHVRGLQAELLSQTIQVHRGGELLTKKRSVKSVKNIISGSLRAMLGQAKADELITRDVFAGLKWPAWDPPEPDPLTPDERARVLEWFRGRRYGLHPGKGSMSNRWIQHAPYFGFVHLLFWSGMRPSEVAGLQWGDIDIANRRLHVRRSFHLHSYGAPKTRQARRTVELFPETVRILRDLQPLHVEPTAPVFVQLAGGPIEPRIISRYWYDALRALGIRLRGLYSTKDTFVTTALGLGCKIPWLEAQTGVNYQTLRKHYGKWVSRDDESELDRFEREDPSLFGRSKLAPKKAAVGGQSDVSDWNHEGGKVVAPGLEPGTSCM